MTKRCAAIPALWFFIATCFIPVWMSGCRQNPPAAVTATELPSGTPADRIMASPAIARETYIPSQTASSAIHLTATASPSATAQNQTECDEEGQLMTEILAAPDLAQSLWVDVYLPPCHSVQSEISYPLLVLLHGQGYDQTQWSALGLVSSADRLIHAGEMPATIILMPYEHYNLQDPTQSVFDILLLDTLLPWAVQALAACDAPECRGIGGISRGGAWALHLGIDHPDDFGMIGMHSAPPFPSDQYRGIINLRDLPEAQRPRLFIDVGDSDTYRGYIVEFHEDLLEQNIRHTWLNGSGGHTDAYWQQHLEEYLLWYADGMEHT